MDQMQSYPPPQYSYPPVNPIAGPVKVIGIIYAVFAVMALGSVLVIVAMGGVLMKGAAAHSTDAPPLLAGPFMMIIAVIVLLAALLNAATAYGLLARKSWGRTLTIVVSILSLLSIPFGTILGGCALYFLMRQGADQDYVRLTLGQP